MWRTFASLALMFLALAWSAFAVVVIFLIVPGLWEAVFGRSGGVIGALAALGAVVWSSGKLMRWADRVLHGGDHTQIGGADQPADRRVRATDADVPRDWHTYNAEIARSKRWAYYRRTRQFERLAELEKEADGPPGP
jgi:hypothetical protein